MYHCNSIEDREKFYRALSLAFDVDPKIIWHIGNRDHLEFPDYEDTNDGIRPNFFQMINYPVSTTVSPTRTANPDMIQKWTEVFKKITNSKCKVQAPFLNKTKSEVILMSKTEKLIDYTWSCSTSQGISKMCGICMACFVRILSLYAINLGEDLNSRYLFNPFKIKSSSLKTDRMTSFRILINCLEFWKNIIQYDDIKNNMEKERYENLAKEYPILNKYSLDMYIGIQKYLDEHTDTEILGQTSRDCIKMIDNKMIEKRQKGLQRLRKTYGWDV